MQSLPPPRRTPSNLEKHTAGCGWHAGTHKTIMKKTLLASILALAAGTAAAQTYSRPVQELDMSGRYRQAVQDGFYDELDTYSGLQRGYNGYADCGYTFGVGPYRMDRYEVQTSHGYQFNPYLFIGGGLGLHFTGKFGDSYSIPFVTYRSRQTDLPLFANVRWTILDKRITPYLDTKIGYFVTHNNGLYASAALGCRIYTVGTQAMNVSVGFAYEELQFDSWDINANPYDHKLGTKGVSLKLGYEF